MGAPLCATAVLALAAALFTQGQAHAAAYTFATINDPAAPGTLAYGNDAGQI